MMLANLDAVKETLKAKQASIQIEIDAIEAQIAGMRDLLKKAENLAEQKISIQHAINQINIAQEYREALEQIGKPVVTESAWGDAND